MTYTTRLDSHQIGGDPEGEVTAAGGGDPVV